MEGIVPSYHRYRPDRRRAEAPAYRGVDRRGLATEDRPPGASFALASGALLVVFLGSVLIVRSQASGPWDHQVVAVQTGAVAVTLAVILGCLGVVRWRLLGISPGLVSATAATVYGLGTLWVGSLLTAGVVEAEGLSWVPHVSRLVAAGLLVTALSSAAVDTRRRPGRLGAAVVTTGVGLVALAGLWPAVGSVLVGRGPLPDGVTTAPLALAWTVAVVGLGATAIWTGLRRRDHLTAWLGLAFAAAGLGEALTFLASQPSTQKRSVAALLVATGMAYAVHGILRDLVRTYRLQGGRLLESVTATRTSEARLSADHAAREERSHEVRNALTAIEAATTLLQRHHDLMSTQLRAELSEGIGTEVRRLQQLVSRPVVTTPGRFRLSEAIAALVTCARSQGTEVTVHVPDDLVAVGRPADTVQVLQNLIQNAQRYGGSRVTVSATCRDGHVVVRVEDQGPGVPADEAAAIFRRGVRGVAAAGTEGDGLGLFVSERLMHQQGGELRLEPGGGGACFAIVLPGFREDTPSTVTDTGAARDEHRDLAGRLFIVPPVTDGSNTSAGPDDVGATAQPLAR